MVFYECVHTGILRVQFNEQYLWAWLTKHNIDKTNIDVRALSYLVEGEINGWDWQKPMCLNELISSVYYKCQVQKNKKT